MVTIYTITYNEELMIEFFILHYRKNFPDCEINIFDNYSTDNTVEIAKKYGCNIFYYDTNNKLSDIKYLEIKNSCWKTSKTDWVVVCDCDELIEIDYDSLQHEQNNNVSVIRPVGYSLMSFNDNIDLNSINMGFRDTNFDKCILFRKSQLKEINYYPGSHNSRPKSNDGCKIIYNEKKYRLLHYKFLNPKHTIERFKLFNNRLSEDNKKNGWGYHYAWSEDKVYQYYKDKEKELIKIK